MGELSKVATRESKSPVEGAEVEELESEPALGGGDRGVLKDRGVPVRETLREAERDVEGVKWAGMSFQCSLMTPFWWDRELRFGGKR